MPPPIGDDELKLKQRARRRLIGAVALVLALIAILPKVLDRAPKPVGREMEVHIPTTEQAKPSPDRTPAPAEAIEPAAKPAPVEAAVTPPGPVVEKLPESVTAKPEPVVPKPEPIVAKPEYTASVTPVSGVVYFVQVGVFSKADNAKAVRSKLAKNHIQKVTHDTLKTAKGNQVRVRVGPFTNHVDAQSVLEKVKHSGEKSAVIISQKMDH